MSGQEAVTISVETVQDAARVLKCIGHPVRLRIIELLDNGDVVTTAAVDDPPDMGIGREVRWSSENDGRLRGRVRQLSPAWVVGEILALALALALLWRSPFRIDQPTARHPAES